MNDVIAIGLSDMQADIGRLERIGSNLANATTVGYQREIEAAQSRRTQTAFAALLTAEPGRAAHRAATSAGASLRDVRPGTLRHTGQPLDVALAGPGYFEVATATGPAYTRNGQFQLDARGLLADQQGHAVMGTGGEIVLTGLPTIDASGAVREGERLIAQLRIVDLEGAERLPRGPGGLHAGGAVPRGLEAEARVRQGHLENANVDPMREMTDLIRTMRHFESVQRAVQLHDEMLGTAIRKLGEA